MSLLEWLREQPALALFLVIGVGYVLGRVRLAGVQIGASAGVLLGGMVLGHLGVGGSAGSQSIGFMLFIYCVGLRAGPQFFIAFRENGGRFALLALSVAIVATLASALLGACFGLPPGYRAGLLAGALTSTPTLVAAQDAVREGIATLPAGYTAPAVLQNISAAYAITYLIGMLGLLVVVALVPRVLGLDLKIEARRLASQREGASATLGPTASSEMPVLRVYQVVHDDQLCEPLVQLSELQRAGCLAQRLKRDGVPMEVTEATRLQPGDLVAVLGRRSDLHTAQQWLGPECVDDELLAVRPEARTILVTGSEGAGYRLGTVDELGCFALRLTRSGAALPLAADLPLESGDLVVAAGLPRCLEALAHRLGRGERPADEADLVTFAFGLAAGIALGSVTVHVAGIPIGLGSAGGLLLSGLAIGFLRTLNPTFGQLPVGGTAVLMELGLLFFMANVGLEAGGSVVGAFLSTGPLLLVAALIVMALAVVAGLTIGRLLGLDVVILLGALTGAMTSTPALDMLNRQADSPLPTVGYAGTYAFANVLLAVAGSLLIRL
jgi:putative transport protein